MNLDEVIRALQTDLQLFVATEALSRLFVHAGVVGWRGRAILVPGTSFSGKTTLVAAMVQAGASYYSDELPRCAPAQTGKSRGCKSRLMKE